MALSLEGADEIARVQKETGRVVFVGYMRRYAAAYLRVKALVEATGRDKINYGACRLELDTADDQSGCATSSARWVPWPGCADDRTSTL